MSLLKTLKNGAVAALSSYRLILVMWGTTLVLALAVGFPLKAFLNATFGNSMAIERFNHGFDVGIAGDLGKPFGALVASATTGGLMLFIAGFLLMIFFTGGLFRRFTLAWGDLRVSDFLQASAVNFVAFFKVTLLMMLIIAGYTLIVVGLPALIIVIISGSKIPSGNVIHLFYIIWALGMPVWLFVADASRRWIAATGSTRAFRAIGTGFRLLREKFWLSYFTVLAVVAVNTLFVAGLTWFAAVSTPDKGFMVFLFFIAIQALFIVRLLMKAWRYAVVCEAIK